MSFMVSFFISFLHPILETVKKNAIFGLGVSPSLENIFKKFLLSRQ